MSRNGSGTYSLPAGNPVVTGTTISSTWANNTLADIATALTGSIAADGQTTPLANLPMGTYAHTNVGNATVRAMYASAGQVQDGSFSYLTSVSGADTITATAPVGMTAYVAGQVFRFVSAGANTGAVTLNLNSIGAKAVTKRGTTALAANDIPSGAAVEVIYDGTQFQLIDPASTSATPVTSITFGSTGLTPATTTTGAVTVAGTLIAANGGTGLTSPGTSGNVLTSNGTSWTSAAAPVSGFSNIQVFTSSGTFTVPAGVTKAKVTVVGGGGSTTSNISASSGGGGGGGTAIEIVSGLTPGGTVSVTVGSAGGTSSFGAYCSATGGGDGVVTNVSGAGGVGTGGDLNLTGMSGTGQFGGSSFLAPLVSGALSNGVLYGGGAGPSSSVTPGTNTGAAGVVIVEY